MSRRVVVDDAAPLIALARIDRSSLVRTLFGRVFITTVVREEVLPSAAVFPDAEELRRTLAEKWIEVVERPNDDWQPLNPAVDRGEARRVRSMSRAAGVMQAMPYCS